MYDTTNFDHRTVNVTVTAGTNGNSEKIDIPSGAIVAMSAVVAGDSENKIIDLSVLQNNNEVVRGADVRFYEKTSAGDYISSMKPVELDGAKQYEVKLVLSGTLSNDITVQTLFLFRKFQN